MGTWGERGGRVLNGTNLEITVKNIIREGARKIRTGLTPLFQFLNVHKTVSFPSTLLPSYDFGVCSTET